VQEEPVDVTLMLDWVPNTNHTGIFVAKDQGYFEKVGLKVEIVQPGEVFAEQAVAGGAADFGISFQEQITLARADNIPLVSIAAILQNNTSGFASLRQMNITSPADWEGLRYGSFGSPFEEPTLRVLMECAGADFSELEIVDTGFSDPLALLDEGQIDLAWVFYGWQGVQAELAGIELEVVMMGDWLECIPDYYTPVLITSERTIEEDPQVVAALVEAVAMGYTFAEEHPDQAAQILLDAVPELDRELVEQSQAWISPRYAADASQWGVQNPEIWGAYTIWMQQNGIINESIDINAAFTNEFLH
jgi:ABC-type nitrate/sulfonate/bicarbonate transport system substrate-binding protein